MLKNDEEFQQKLTKKDEIIAQTTEKLNQSQENAI